MKLGMLDLGVIIAYIAITVVIGFWISKRASRNIQSYFLGGNEIPWYMLGLSNASGMFDISGTMWLVYLLFIYGLKSVWIPWLWPVFNQIFLMVFLSIWLRRSGVMTGAEWIQFRFGKARGANLSHIIVVAFALLNVLGFLAYGFIGIGKFAAVFISWKLSSDPYWNEILYGLIITAVTTLYVVKGGMFSVVFTEVLQFLIMTVASIAIGIIAMSKVSPELLQSIVPDSWYNMFFGWKLDLDWSATLQSANQKISADGYSLFGIFFMMMLFKGVLLSLAGPAPNYDMQRVLSAKTPKEAAKMSGFVNVVLFFPRYMLIAGLTVLALAFFMDDLRGMGDNVDFELILPFALKNFIPAGLLGLVIAGLLAAFMSTFAATTNAAPAYVVNDIYKRYFKPDAPAKQYVRLSYLVSILFVVIGTFIGLFIHSLNEIIGWIVSALYGGYTASNVLKWYWWRFNGYGYFWGMLTGIIAAMIIPFLIPYTNGLYAFPVIVAISLVGAIAGSLLTPPDDEEVLKNFYLRVRPWGFWKPVYEKLKAEKPDLQKNTAFGRDMLNVVIGIIWQTGMVAAAIFLVIRQFDWLGVSVAAVAICSLVLKKTWYDKMENYPADC
ncbi:MAG TPA: Na+:solute symporter [Flavilitoribacter sp.]|nr:Na+:solute symporter [Flavilitoribacter sp.]HMQ89465.1 Na+:solute symporter [Flavilitoribacter sp.]